MTGSRLLQDHFKYNFEDRTKLNSSELIRSIDTVIILKLLFLAPTNPRYPVDCLMLTSEQGRGEGANETNSCNLVCYY